MNGCPQCIDDTPYIAYVAERDTRMAADRLTTPINMTEQLTLEVEGDFPDAVFVL